MNFNQLRRESRDLCSSETSRFQGGEISTKTITKTFSIEQEDQVYGFKTVPATKLETVNTLKEDRSMTSGGYKTIPGTGVSENEAYKHMDCLCEVKQISNSKQDRIIPVSSMENSANYSKDINRNERVIPVQFNGQASSSTQEVIKETNKTVHGLNASCMSIQENVSVHGCSLNKEQKIYSEESNRTRRIIPVQVEEQSNQNSRKQVAAEETNTRIIPIRQIYTNQETNENSTKRETNRAQVSNVQEENVSLKQMCGIYGDKAIHAQRTDVENASRDLNRRSTEDIQESYRNRLESVIIPAQVDNREVSSVIKETNTTCVSTQENVLLHNTKQDQQIYTEETNRNERIIPVRVKERSLANTSQNCMTAEDSNRRRIPVQVNTSTAEEIYTKLETNRQIPTQVSKVQQEEENVSCNFNKRTHKEDIAESYKNRQESVIIPVQVDKQDASSVIKEKRGNQTNCRTQEQVYTEETNRNERIIPVRVEEQSIKNASHMTKEDINSRRIPVQVNTSMAQEIYTNQEINKNSTHSKRENNRAIQEDEIVVYGDKTIDAQATDVQKVSHDLNKRVRKQDLDETYKNKQESVVQLDNQHASSIIKENCTNQTNCRTQENVLFQEQIYTEETNRNERIIPVGEEERSPANTNQNGRIIPITNQDTNENSTCTKQTKLESNRTVSKVQQEENVLLKQMHEKEEINNHETIYTEEMDINKHIRKENVDKTYRNQQEQVDTNQYMQNTRNLTESHMTTEESNRNIDRETQANTRTSTHQETNKNSMRTKQTKLQTNIQEQNEENHLKKEEVQAIYSGKMHASNIDSFNKTDTQQICSNIGQESIDNNLDNIKISEDQRHLLFQENDSSKDNSFSNGYKHTNVSNKNAKAELVSCPNGYKITNEQSFYTEQTRTFEGEQRLSRMPSETSEICIEEITEENEIKRTVV